MMPEDRPAIPAEIERQVLVEAGHRCAVCGDHPVERAHIIAWSKSKSHSADNLVALCPSCHTRADTEGWGAKTLRAYKENPWILRKGNAINPLKPVRLVTIRLPIELDEFDDIRRVRLLCTLAGLLGISPDEIEIVAVEEGNSIIVTISVPEEFAEELNTKLDVRGNVERLIGQREKPTVENINELIGSKLFAGAGDYDERWWLLGRIVDKVAEIESPEQRTVLILVITDLIYGGEANTTELAGVLGLKGPSFNRLFARGLVSLSELLRGDTVFQVEYPKDTEAFLSNLKNLLRK